MRIGPLLASVAVLAAALVALYWFAVGGASSPAPPSWLTRTPIAHRGLHSGDARVPENSLAAFRAAAEAGYPIELDVHLTSDGKLVVTHDDTLERMTGDPRRIGEVTLADLRELRLLGTDERVPTLDEVLAEVRGRVPILVEVKNEGSAGPLEDALAEELRAYDGDVAVISFNPNSLARLGRLSPNVPRGQLSGSFEGEDLEGYKKFVLRHLLMNWRSRPDFVAYELDALPCADVSLQRRLGRSVLAWTATDRESSERARQLADNLVFELEGRP